MAKRFPKVRCSEVTIKTIHNPDGEKRIVPSENAEQAIAQFNRPDARVTAAGNIWAQVTETDGETFNLETKSGAQFTLEPGDPGYDRLCTAYNKLLAEIDEDKRRQYEES